MQILNRQLQDMNMDREKLKIPLSLSRASTWNSLCPVSGHKLIFLIHVEVLEEVALYPCPYLAVVQVREAGNKMKLKKKHERQLQDMNLKRQQLQLPLSLETLKKNQEEEIKNLEERL